MCRFKIDELAGFIGKLKKFQYILCVGSRFFIFSSLYRYICFNTSYVSVQDIEKTEPKRWCRFQYILCVGSRSITDIKEYED